MAAIEVSPLFVVKGKKIVVESKDEFPIQVGGDFLGNSTKMVISVKRKQKVLMI